MIRVETRPVGTFEGDFKTGRKRCGEDLKLCAILTRRATGIIIIITLNEDPTPGEHLKPEDW